MRPRLLALAVSILASWFGSDARADEARRFPAAQLEGGFQYLRALVAYGFGEPFRRALALEARGAVNTGAVQGALAVHASYPYIDFRVGGRLVQGFAHSYLIGEQGRDVRDLATLDNGKASYAVFETEGAARIPLGDRLFLAPVATMMSVRGVPEGKFVYEESLRVVATPPLILRGRLTLWFLVTKDDALRIGPVAELIVVPDQVRGRTVRAGGALELRASSAVDLVVTIVPSILSPDRLGLAGADVTDLGLRVRWWRGP